MTRLEREILNIKRDTEKIAEKDIKRLAREYKKSLADIRAIVLQVYTKYSDDDGELNISNAQLINEMNRLDKVLEREARRIGLLEVGLVTALLTTTYKHSYYKTAYTLDKGIELGVNYRVLRPEFIERAINVPIEGYMYSDRIWLNKEVMMQRLRRDLINHMQSGTSVEKLSRKLSKDLGSDYYNSYRLIRNETARVQSEAQEQIYQDSDSVQSLLFDATLDDRTTELCQGLHGTVYRKDEPHPKIPDDTHIQCRSAYIPIVEGWNPTKKRDNLSKQNIDYPSNFEDWKRSNSIE
ncbi:SPP1 gp7 family putative phage head morphogenesis protein [Natranaerovirga pectinivora]|uniref:SPP1 gp7 family putative phage head morphogenesis protein n=1 Tax=Natranaerovirga pectinivora TaxID=682400 RepID=A0A4R3MR35_9FIRM|nr:minor capsid protein [Natranaerovirga pectinivora]TCT16396.1 SPP1 gp7 family putative phage head morphogenesis protein [Natranaerovirga pectinivora]